MVKYLITSPKLWSIWNERKIVLGEDLKVTDYPHLRKGFEKVDIKDPFVPIHMASQGYWQINGK